MKTSNSKSLNWAHPLIQEWFITHLGQPTEPQIKGWPSILARIPTLISSPTGSGKTLAAFLVCINQLIKKSIAGELKQKTEILYISPLKALGNDIQKNLMHPLSQIQEIAKEKGVALGSIEVAVRSGDTPQKERQQMLKKPPHILVTTPESLYILLTAEKSREMLKDVKTVIVDEIHALINNKRGAHLTLSLERLQALTHNIPLRIGLSATQKPLELVAQYLTGTHVQQPNVIQVGYKKQLDLSIELPKTELGPIASNEMWDEIYDKISEKVQENRSTLVFVNTRRLAERVAHHLGARIGEEWVAAHHGSLSRKLRHSAETRLKNGELKVLVATASLELGIDIGNIDLVCQIGTTRSINIALQRVGRAGHFVGAVSRGIFFATTRDELLECAAILYAIKMGELDELIIQRHPIDILTQQIVAICATGDWQEEALFQLVTRAYPYRDLSRQAFEEIIEMLSNGIVGSRSRYSAYLFRDKVNGIVKARRGSRLISITSGGAIPENGLFTVISESEGVVVGTLDEDFAVESNRGDIILLGTTSWQILRIESKSAKVFVENAHGAPPSVPFWRGEAPGRTKDLSYYVSLLRETLDNFLFTNENNKITAINWLTENCGLEEQAATQAINYIIEGKKILGAVPTQNKIIAERFFDEAGGMQLIIHAPFGMAINRAWGLALRKKFCRSFNFELQAAATDNGLNISLAEQHSFPLKDVFQFLHPNTLKDVLTQAVLQSPIFKTRWRWVATLSLALQRFRKGTKVPPNIQRMLSDDLLAAVFPDAAACQDNLAGRDIELPEHPLVKEAVHDTLTEAMDFEGLLSLIQNLKDNKIEAIAIDTPFPSVFSNEILNANPYAFLDDAPLEERRARAVELRRILPDSVLEEAGQLDLESIETVIEQAWPDVRNEDELHDALQTFIAFPQAICEHSISEHFLKKPNWQSYFDKLVLLGRAGMAVVNTKRFYFATERKKVFQLLYPEARFESKLKDIQDNIATRDEALVKIIQGWVFHTGPITAQELSLILGLAESDIQHVLLTLENSGLILRGQFYPNVAQLQWCERRLLARIHKSTLFKLRKEIEPVTAETFVKWLLKWQHLHETTQLKGKRGLVEIIRQLQGFEIPANAWERLIFSKRIKDYSRDLLDTLCLTGEVSWGRLSPHTVLLDDEDILKDKQKSKEKQNSKNKKHKSLHDEQENLLETQDNVVKRRIRTTSITPITFFIREESSKHLTPHFIHDETHINLLSPIAKIVYNFLSQKGASFIDNIVRGTKRLPSEVENALWELVAIGAITSDSFDNLRALIDPKRRLKQPRYNQPFRFNTGRWCLLQPQDEPLDKQEKLISEAWMLLKRYGVVFRDLILREKNIPPWAELLPIFRLLESKGEIRGGRFVSGFRGEQFALPYAVESLRAAREEYGNKEGIATKNETIAPKQNVNQIENNNKNEKGEIKISAVDPLNLIGIILPGEKISALSKTEIFI